MNVDNTENANTSAAGTKALPNDVAVYNGSMTTFGSLKNTAANAIQGSTADTLTSTALFNDLKGVKADTFYFVFNNRDSKLLTASDLNSNGTIKDDVIHNNDDGQFVAVKVTLTRDDLVSTEKTSAPFTTAEAAAEGITSSKKVGAFTTPTTKDDSKSTPAQYYFASAVDNNFNYGNDGRILTLNYNVSKSNAFGISQNTTPASSTFDKLYSLNIK